LFSIGNKSGVDDCEINVVSIYRNESEGKHLISCKDNDSQEGDAGTCK